MYRSKNSINASTMDVTTLVEGDDIFNSETIFATDKYSATNEGQIDKHAGRMDLSIENVTPFLYGFNMIHNRITDLKDLSIGTTFENATDVEVSMVMQN